MRESLREELPQAFHCLVTNAGIEDRFATADSAQDLDGLDDDLGEIRAILGEEREALCRTEQRLCELLVSDESEFKRHGGASETDLETRVDQLWARLRQANKDSVDASARRIDESSLRQLEYLGAPGATEWKAARRPSVKHFARRVGELRTARESLEPRRGDA